jgi:3-dehydroquinate synthase
MRFTLSEFTTDVLISSEIPTINTILDNDNSALIVCDENTGKIADTVCANKNIPRCVLSSGEENKNWNAVEQILKTAHKAALARDSFIIGIGGGVVGDLSGFAASIYMRGCHFVQVATTLLAMVDASIGGKTGFDLFGIKNLAGSFYPAKKVYIPLDSLATLPLRELKNGLAELIKTAILCGDNFLDKVQNMPPLSVSDSDTFLKNPALSECITEAVRYKGFVASQDLRENGIRMLLNLGHTFGHALESAAGLGTITHGEAIAWGMYQAVKLGLILGITPKDRAEKICKVLDFFNYESRTPHPLCTDTELIFNAMANDKKKRKANLTFIVPDDKSAAALSVDSTEKQEIVMKIIKGEIKF